MNTCQGTANLSTNILDFREFDSSMIIILKGGIPRPKDNFPEVSVKQSWKG